MNNICFIYDQYKDLFVKPCISKYRIDGDFLILMSYNLEIIYLSNISKNIYMLIKDGIYIKDLFQKIFDEYDVKENVLKSDILDFIRDMQSKDFVTLEVRNS